jgi:cobalt-zinc-cadmium resistance protein CzcA
VVISGLMTATMMTLVLMPLLYRWFDDQPKPEESETLADELSSVANADLPPSLISRMLARFRKGSPATRG